MLPTDRHSNLRLLVLRIIEAHPKSNRVTIATITKQLGIEDREVKRYVSELRGLGFKIGRVKGKNPGYFKAENAAEIIDTVDEIKQEAMKMLILCRKLLDFSAGEPTIWDQDIIIDPLLDEIGALEESAIKEIV